MSLFALQILLVGGAVQGLCLALLLATRRTNQLANRLLAVLILLISSQSVLVAFDTRELFLAFPHLSKVSWLQPALFGPLIYLFTRKLTSEEPRLQWRDARHLLPFAVVLAYLLPYYLQPASAKIAYLNDFAAASKDDFGWLNQLLNGLHLFYLALSLRALRQHAHHIRDVFSNLTHVRLRWLRQFLLLALGTVAVGIAAFYGRKWNIAWLSDIYHFHYLCVIGLIYWIGYKALSQPTLFGHIDGAPAPAPGAVTVARTSAPLVSVVAPPLETHEATTATLAAPAAVAALQPSLATPPETTLPAKPVAPAPEVALAATAPAAAPPKYQKSALTDEQAEGYLDRLLDFMQTKKPHQQNELTIQDLALAVGIPRHQLSQLLNERLGKNFYDFINEYRVAEVKRLLRHPRYAHYTTLAVAEEAGFNSKATFNAVFKKLTGMTPSEFTKKTELEAELVV
jgi:AraC-like DNA-binding protein